MNSKVTYFGGPAGAALPFLVFLGGVAWLGLSGAPDERGFWPVILLAIAVGLGLARDRQAYSTAVIESMGRPLVMIMVMAWLLAGVLGTLISASGFIDVLVAGAHGLGATGGAYVVFALVIAATVATATGTSLGTILIVGPLLYPAGGTVQADPALLIGAIMGGATFGDNVSPVSDTTIASASTQEADIGGVVRTRMKYAVPAGIVAMTLYLVFGGVSDGTDVAAVEINEYRLSTLLVLLGPGTGLVLLMRRRHLLEGLLGGIVVTVILGVVTGAFALPDLLFIDHDNFIASGLLLDGMQRGVGASIFTILLMGLVGGIEASGLLDRVLTVLNREGTSMRGAEVRLFATVSAAVVLTTHSVVALLAVGDLARRVGRRVGLSRYRVANILDATVCTYPFLLPFFIPTILASTVTGGHDGFGMPRVSPFEAGLYNFHSWALLAMVVLAIVTGYGRSVRAADPDPVEVQGEGQLHH